ncbi:MAG: TauD/TfdA family dioxygenase, partial [Acidobacteriaceae bacterium]
MLDRQGFAFIPRHVPDQEPLQAIGHLGAVVSVAAQSDTQSLRPRRLEEAPRNIYSGNYGLSEFPLHTDLAHWYVPPRYLALRCIVGASNVDTLLLDGRLIEKEIGRSTLRRTLAQPRRPLNGRLPLLRILEEPQKLGALIRWDSLFIRPASDASTDTFNRIQVVLREALVIRVTLTSPGDTLIIDNWRMLHGRSSVPRDGLRRHVERAYLGK